MLHQRRHRSTLIRNPTTISATPPTAKTPSASVPATHPALATLRNNRDQPAPPEAAIADAFAGLAPGDAVQQCLVLGALAQPGPRNPVVAAAGCR
jgi:hypothetical protein